MKIVTNVSHILTETFKRPNEVSAIDLESGDNFIPLGGVEKVRRPPALLKPGFKWALIMVVGITVLSGILVIALAGIWPAPTPNQQSAFEAFGFAWKAGIGAIFGLVGGKVA